MHSEYFLRRLFYIYAVFVAIAIYGAIESEDDSQIISMTFSRVSTFQPFELFYMKPSLRTSRIECFSLCLNKLSQCIGVIYYKIQQLCRLLTADVTKEPMSLETLESGLMALKQIHVCDYGFHFYKGHCYGVGKFKMTWTDSKFECEQIGAYLVEVETVDENTWLTRTFLPPTDITAECPDVWECSVWIGAERLNAGDFIWNRRGNILTFAPWYPGEPDTRECVHLLRTALWDDDYCHIPKHYICEKELETLQSGG